MSWFNRNSLGAPRLPAQLVLVSGLVALGQPGCSTDDRALSTRSDQAKAGAPRENGAGATAGNASAGAAGRQPLADEDDGEAGSSAGGVEAGTAGDGGSHTGGSSTAGTPSGGGSTGGISTGGSSTAGGSVGGTLGGGGTSGVAGEDDGAGGCGDLDGDRVQDCEQTLVANPRFDAGVESWQVEAGAAQQRDARNARPDQPHSGSLLLRSTKLVEGEGYLQSGSGQCLPASGNIDYLMAARSFIPEGQGQGSAGISLWFYGADHCADYLLSSASLQTTTSTDSWKKLSGEATTPPATRSIFVRLVVSKPFSQPSFEALFDDILLRER